MHDAVDLWVAIAYTGLVALIVPVYAVAWGWRNFLWFSDIALITTVAALWLHSRLLASMMALAVLAPDLVWCTSYFGRLLFGIRATDLAGYMFDSTKSRFVRGLSLFHLVLPLVLLWLLHEHGYDERALVAQTLARVDRAAGELRGHIAVRRERQLGASAGAPARAHCAAGVARVHDGGLSGGPVRADALGIAGGVRRGQLTSRHATRVGCRSRAYMRIGARRISPRIDRWDRARMQRASIVTGALLMAASFGTPAEGIHKCVTPSVTSYQSAPCADPRDEAALAPAIAALERTPGETGGTSDPDAAGSPAPAASMPADSPPVATATAKLPLGSVPLAVGMLDVEALNSPKWGRPDAIERSRDRRGWREVWTYDRGPAGARELEFRNGRLTAIVNAPDAIRVASTSVRGSY
jgi:hypothetical protein